MSMCGQAVGRRRVPLISLQTVLEDWLPERRIAFVKVDAQGYDPLVAQSAGRAAHRIEAIQLEMTAPKCALPYGGAPNCTATLQQMARLGGTPGFLTNGRCTEPRHFSAGSWGCNGDFVFWPHSRSPQKLLSPHRRHAAFERKAPDVRGRMGVCCPRPLFTTAYGFAGRPNDCAFICRDTPGCVLFSHSPRRFECVLCPAPPSSCRFDPPATPPVLLTPIVNEAREESPTTWHAAARASIGDRE